jgi:hypothetical protein
MTVPHQGIFNQQRHQQTSEGRRSTQRKKICPVSLTMRQHRDRDKLKGKKEPVL